MVSKYYTPTIEEFHVGFEYEVYEPDYGGPVELEYCWKQNTFESYTFDSEIETIDGEMPFEAGIVEKRLRVKYLDKEDIESLGFGGYIPPHEYDHTWAKAPYVLKAWFHHEVPVVRILYSPNTILFHGEIKNKSELKVLLKQLGIDE